MRAARWAFDDRDAGAAMQWLDQLPVGAARRTIALRLRFKAARQSGKSRLALETVRQLTKHRSFSEAAGRSIARGLAIEMIRSAHDQVQVQAVWDALNSDEQGLVDVAVEAAERLMLVGGDVELALRWVLPMWNSHGAVGRRPDAGAKGAPGARAGSWLQCGARVCQMQRGCRALRAPRWANPTT